MRLSPVPRLARRVAQKLGRLRNDFAQGVWVPPGRAHGIDALRDIRSRTTSDLAVVFDVGANVGQSADAFARELRGAEIHCFEPIHDTFVKLAARFEYEPRVHCHEFALGAKRDRFDVVLEPNPLENSLRNRVGDVDHAGRPVERVEVDTLDRFCARFGIASVDLLKIDAEGFDLAVLEGADALLQEHRVRYIQVEAGMGRHNEKHVPLQVFEDYLEPRGYSLFGLYGQIQEWWNDLARLRFCNPLFISQPEIAAHSRPGVRQEMF